jgi:long-chain acyl-CoA synthetase
VDLPEHVATVLGLDPARRALQYAGEWFTWGEVSDGAKRLDACLNETGTEFPVGVIIRNRPAVIAAILALLSQRRCVAVLNPLLPDAVLAGSIMELRPASVLALEEDLIRPGVREAINSAGSLELSVGSAVGPLEVGGGFRGQRADFYAADRGVAVAMLTSGTTGPPKRIPIRYRDFERALDAHARISGNNRHAVPRLSPATNILAVAPVNITGMWQLISTVAVGRSLALLDRFRVEDWVRLVEEHRPRAGRIPPTAVKMVLDARPPSEALASLKAIWCGGARLDPEVGRQFEDRYGIPVLQAYGSTEFAGGVATWSRSDWYDWRDTKRGSVGRPNTGVEIRTVDKETGEFLAAHESGLLIIRARHAATNDDSGWVKTNDIGRMDEDGFLWIDGRADDVINRGGHKVHPAEVESALNRHPAVADVAVVPLPDDRLGQVPGALIVLAPGHERPAYAELADWVKQRLAPYCAPVLFRYVEAIPRNAAMKTVRFQAIELLTRDDGTQ